MTKPKIILYNPKAVFFTMPLALVAIASGLDPDKYDISIVDGRLEPDPLQTVLSQVDDAVCLGVTVLTGAPIHDALRISRAAKSRRPHLPVIWGGWHPSLFPEETLAEPCVDITVQGQGEDTFCGLVENITADGWPIAAANTEPPPGATWRVDGAPVRGNARPLRDMNELPPHRYDLLPVERYFDLKGANQLD